VIIKDSVAIVTGGASGLGEACVRDLLKCGAKVAIFDFAVEKGEKLSAELGKDVIFAQTDVSDEAGVQAAINKTMDTFGAIHFAINCAGGALPAKVLSKKGPMPLDVFSYTIKINLIGTFNVIRLAVEQMVKNQPNSDGEKGVIINTSSVAAFDGQVGQAEYSASKAGIVGMTLPIARECADYGIRVMTIAPGLFDTPLLGALPEDKREALGKSVPFPQRLGKPQEFAALVHHIIENPMLNGEVIRLDGAIRMPPK
jgi:3-hydroxyacyl-CoA dehydrogenase / 3-hydroxy-2-methylbutyryl-CoA dehydrogenase